MPHTHSRCFITNALMNWSSHLWSLLHSIYSPLPFDLSFFFFKYPFLLQNTHSLAEKLLLFSLFYKMKHKFLRKAHQALSNWPQPTLPASRRHHIRRTSVTTKPHCSSHTSLCWHTVICLHRCPSGFSPRG